ncbi:RagB/SusD family nutrient uptake outer membrane protein [Pedobacter sp. ISL-68]|uniref:RagB/SusD family nutrient uptake outer membrane protein n=1 Tax=unclassified Pedobacter TaxID=2628915 RepID=UPI001BED0E9C|nr:MULTISPECIES: RagB/SusD family nutrient uptake outer membrane protein [unclassified Pedobacter]MBT2563742.1 RagB/SusD family nutrient uptake outer membrane protein [Pedobacter sp. ISL-64]MBT2589634.1 RagB/SusD family nutrient uptake outer membrane protein [Pedobacter sp. ISL-68]
MKKNIYTIIITIIVITGVSCKKSFLDRVPSDYISENEVFNNINNAEGFVNNFYVNIGSWNYGSGVSYVTSAMTDESKQRWANGAILFNTAAWNPSNFSPISLDWTQGYAIIRSINTFLANYDKVPEDPNDPDRRTRLKGEALMLRAYYHFVLFRGWGKIPLLAKPLAPATDGDAVFLERSDLPVVIAFINKDLDDAMALLPEKHSSNALWGRGTKTICMAIKSRMSLFYASALFNPNNDITRWQTAATLSKQALDMALANGYTLTPKYADAFLTYAPTECIWGRNMGDGGGGGATAIDQVMQPLGYSGYTNCGPIQDLVDEYEMKTGVAINAVGSGWDPKHPYKNRDPRFYASILYPGAKWKNRTINIYTNDKDNASEPGTNYWWKKFMTESLVLPGNTGGSNKTWTIFRTGELMLNYAEAQNEAVGPDATVYSAINAIRTRAGMPNISPGLTQSQMRTAIRHERRIELVFEGHRFWDVRRWKIAEIVDNKPVFGVNYTLSPTNATDTTFTYFQAQNRVFDASKHYFMPVPQSEMDKLTGKNPGFTQTPGW